VAAVCGKAARTVLCGRRAVRVLTTIAKKKHTVITVILLDKLRFEKQKFRPRFLHQGRTKAGAELAMTGNADENPIHRSGSAHFLRVALVAAEPSATGRTKSELLLDRLRR